MPTWTVKFNENARRELRKLDAHTENAILRYMRTKIAGAEDPRRLGKALKGEMQGLWRYRVGDYRIIADLQGEVLTVVVVRIGHHREIYR